MGKTALGSGTGFRSEYAVSGRLQACFSVGSYGLCTLRTRVGKRL